MNKNSRKAIVYLGVIALISLSPAAYSQPYGNTQGEGKGFKKVRARERFLESLNLTDEQKKKLKEQSAVYRKKSKVLREQIRDKRKELKDVLDKDTFDKKEIDSIVSAINYLSAERLKQMVDRIVSTKEILTPEQFKEFQEKMKKIKERIRERSGNRNNKGNPSMKGM